MNFIKRNGSFLNFQWLREISRFIFSACVFLILSGVCLAHADSIIDVRTAEEFVDGHVKGALNIDILQADFKDRIKLMDKNTKVKLYCRSGNRSKKAKDLMVAEGFKDVENLGSLQEAIKALHLPCEGKKGCQ